MEVLLFLVQQRGELVSREQIVEKIWGKGVYFDTDNSINGAIRKIRQALKDDPEEPHFIQTITGKGYRFISPVADFEPPGPVPVPDLPPPTPQPVPVAADEPVRWRLLLPLGILILLVAAWGVYSPWYGARVRPAAPV